MVAVVGSDLRAWKPSNVTSAASLASGISPARSNVACIAAIRAARLGDGTKGPCVTLNIQELLPIAHITGNPCSRFGQ